MNTEPESSMHIKDKSAANSTIFLVCRPREIAPKDEFSDYWEVVEPLVALRGSRRFAKQLNCVVIFLQPYQRVALAVGV